MKPLLTKKIFQKSILRIFISGHKTSLENNECYSYRFKKSWKQCPATDMSVSREHQCNFVSTHSALSQFMDDFLRKLISFTSLKSKETLYDAMEWVSIVQVSLHGKRRLSVTQSSIRMNLFGSCMTLKMDGFDCILSNDQLYPAPNSLPSMDIYSGKSSPISANEIYPVYPQTNV